MRLQCEVQILNRLVPNASSHKSARAVFTHVSLGRKPGHRDGPVLLMLCTAKNRNGDKFKLHKNVENIFSRFIKEGKATLRLTEPSCDIAFSKADPSQLNLFLRLVRFAYEGRDVPDKTLSVLAPVSAKHVEKPVTKLVITKPSEYPMSMPKSLEKLTINECLLRRVSPQIISLPGLKELDMGFNQLTTLPDSFSEVFNLRCLLLPCNKLTVFPPALLTGKLRRTLCVLDLKQNEIDRLPSDIIKLKSLLSLNISHNQLRCLPESLGMMASLRNVQMSNNHLDFLPGSFLTNTFESVDFSDNPFLGQLPQPLVSSASFTFPSLAECAAKVIIQHRIHYTVEDLDFMSMNYLKTAHRCICGNVCFESGKSCLVHKAVPSTLSYVSGNVPFLIRYCTKRCLETYK